MTTQRLRLRRWMAVALFPLSFAAVQACSDSPSEPLIPLEPPGIVGRITNLEPAGQFRGTMLVEFDPASPTNGAKALVTITGATIIVAPAGEEVEFRAVTTGQWVRVWFAGEVKEGYPVEGVASAIAIDSLGVVPVPF